MKYIAFEGTHNEQVWDSETRTVKWTRSEHEIVDCEPVIDSGTWRLLEAEGK